MKSSEKLRMWRILFGLTQSEIAETLNKSQHNVAGMENGRYKPRIMVIAAYAKYFGVSQDYFSSFSPGDPFHNGEAFLLFLPPLLFKKRYSDPATQKRKFNELAEILTEQFVEFLNDYFSHYYCGIAERYEKVIFIFENRKKNYKMVVKIIDDNYGGKDCILPYFDDVFTKVTLKAGSRANLLPKNYSEIYPDNDNCLNAVNDLLKIYNITPVSKVSMGSVYRPSPVKDTPNIEMLNQIEELRKYVLDKSTPVDRDKIANMISSIIVELNKHQGHI